MEFRFTAEEEAFRDEIRSFLDSELPLGWEDRFPRGEQRGSGDTARWEFGRQGLGAGVMQQMIYNEEVAYRRAPSFSMGVAWVGPALMLYGTDEQKQRFLPPITDGSEVWCTLYSEPGSGSDLASLQTRAVADGDDYVINGQKIWTSGAHRSDWGWLAARTDPDAPKHKGISLFLLDMKTLGVSVRPLINMADGHEFNEVFFDNVRIPKQNLVGTEHRGWYQLAVALDFERSSIGGSAGAQRSLDDLLGYIRDSGQPLTAVMRHQLADRQIEISVGRNLSYRIAAQQQKGQVPNHEASAAKLYSTELNQRLARTAIDVLGMAGTLDGADSRAPANGAFKYGFLRSVANTIEGGTSEVQRGIIATRGLGLPRG
ncbi:MAG: acyl-CoA dehydrogenase family protein [Chloroflexi bacterium]|nr:acyl-CoA dehydrogenase family protein [Chloroflexota bacterium]